MAFEESLEVVDSELGLTGGPLELNETNVLAVQVKSRSKKHISFVARPFIPAILQDQLKAEIASLEKWLAECDPQSEDSDSDVVKEVRRASDSDTPHSSH